MTPRRSNEWYCCPFDAVRTLLEDRLDDPEGSCSRAKQGVYAAFIS